MNTQPRILRDAEIGCSGGENTQLLNEINAGHYTEAIHIAHVAASFVEEHVSDHILIDTIPELKALADEAVTKLAELYQLIGSYEERFLEEEEKMKVL